MKSNYYSVYVSATVDYLTWTCPKCHKENESGNDLNTCCESCGYDIQNDVDISTDLSTELTGCYDEEEEEED